MARRRYRRRNYRKKRRSEQDLVFGLFGATFLLAFINSLSFEGTRWSVDYMKLFMVVLLVCLGLLLIYAVVLMIRKGVVGFFQQLARGQLFEGSHYIEDLIAMDPRTFEYYVGGMFENQGYKVEKVTQYSADNGIDVILRKDGKRYAVQAKRYSGKNYVTAHEVRDFFGSYSSEKDGFAGGIFVTTSYFGKQARAWAEERGMELIDRPKLSTMVRGYDFEHETSNGAN